MEKDQQFEDFLLSYREVIPNQTNPLKWKEISLYTGKYAEWKQILRLKNEIFCLNFRRNAKLFARYQSD